jgi:hypothetical protein
VQPVRRELFSATALAIPIAVLIGSCAIRCGSDSGTTPSSGSGDRGGGEADTASCLDGQRAFGHIERLLAHGPRHAGTQGLEQARRQILYSLRQIGLEPQRHDFEALTPHPVLKRVSLANITADVPGSGQGTVIVGGHFDGKLIDGVVFQGANDGGSSTGLLLEIARCLKQHPPPCTVRLAFFDGEEALVEWSDSDGLYGSKHMPAQLKASDEHRRIAAMVNLDMIGDKRLRLYRESQSTPWVFDALERAARRLGHGELFGGPRGAIEDDHVPFLEIGIPAANLIDLKFGQGWNSNSYWHTDRDTLDKISPDNMVAIGQVVIGALPRLCRGQPAQK